MGKVNFPHFFYNMKTIHLALAISVSVAILSSCGKSGSPYTPDCTGTTPKFSANVSSIIASDCASSGCHDKGSKKGPGELITYAQISASAASIRSEVVNGTMPRNSTLSTERRNAIVCWIDAGAKND